MQHRRKSAGRRGILHSKPGDVLGALALAEAQYAVQQLERSVKERGNHAAMQALDAALGAMCDAALDYFALAEKLRNPNDIITPDIDSNELNRLSRQLANLFKKCDAIQPLGTHVLSSPGGLAAVHLSPESKRDQINLIASYFIARANCNNLGEYSNALESERGAHKQMDAEDAVRIKEVLLDLVRTIAGIEKTHAL